ncbi:type I site-specific deoxyribonuclease, HsdR family [Desulfitobacterium dichloroeliminans LMG P-21439]|uniref:Type I restriction enzyme endonuclease subunit n=1 Tax=Desulfitobacterium dichloroeliminans (strain LMG P-21439 / DCA1) TaxID=871963 RepID=L0F1X1_DESDL|nr:type I restriction endonuclease subunit R [Desulfitobacterium dichloroeliminans]AGA67859.1 type I site-specific deoxyribonuclease, HsdR family [Desulfitobacterium dichloroeliminans LMG P-21439]
MSKNFCESHLEEATLEWFEELGYEIVFAPDIAPDGDYPERGDYGDITLNDRLKEALQRINPRMRPDALEDAFRQITIPQSPSLIMNNKAFQKMITDGIDVQVKQADASYRTEKVYVFDFEKPLNNEFMVANQFTFIEHGVEKRPDVIAFVNGIPLVVMELKSASDENVDITDAYNQLQTYKMTIPSLFTYNSFLVTSDGVNARAGTLTSDEDRFMAWRTIDGETTAPLSIPQLEVLIKGMFQRDRFLDIIRHFVLFQSDSQDTIKILAGYHQYHAVNKAIESTERATQESGDRRIGVIWHTQGSGKSLSMVFYAGKLVINEGLENPTIVIITDRNDLDDQLFGTFLKSKGILRSTPVQATDRTHLRDLLNNRTSGGIIFTTIHKFAPVAKEAKEECELDRAAEATALYRTEDMVLTDRKNVIVMADEAHRSQYGFEAEIMKGDDEANVKYGYAKYMRDSLPNASYIGFTGTPVELTDKNTRAVFGDYIDVYDMTRAVEDGTTVKIFYESRIAKLELPEELKPKVDTEYDEITEYQEYTQKEKLKSKWARLEAIVGASERVKQIAKDIVEHFEKREQAQENAGGKAMIVAMSRRIAIDLYQEIVTIRPEWHSDDLMAGKIKVVMTGASSDPAEWQKFIGKKASRETLAKRMKDKNDELKLVIVRDMWLTGFDVPSMHTMYIDKPMQGHNLMQAIARVNRVFKEKQGGLIVDYIGIAENLKEALAQYTESDKKTTGVDTEVAGQELLIRHDLIKELLHGHDYSKFFTGKPSEKMQAIVETMDYIIGLREDRKNDYIKLVTEMARAYSLCATTDIAESLNVEVGFHKAVKASLVKMISNDNRKKTTTQLDSELNQLISKSISSNEVIDILSSVGLSKPNIAILSEEFLEEVKGMKQKNLAVELLNRLLKGGIKTFSRRNLVQSKKFSELLDAAIRKYQNRAIETTQVIMELIELAKQISEAEKRGESTGLTPDELAFYDALADNDSAREIMGDEILKQIARDLTQSIKKNISVDWAIRESVQAKMKMTIKRLLKKYGYPPDKTAKAVDIVMEQTKLMCQNESR